MLVSGKEISEFTIPAASCYMIFLSSSIFYMIKNKGEEALPPFVILSLAFLNLMIPSGILFILAASAMYRGF